MSIGEPAGQPEARPGLAEELAAEQAYVTGLYHRLDELRARSARSLAELRRSPRVPTPAGRAERDAFDALHTERIAQLQAVEDRLCFGRLDLTEGRRRYIGRLGLSDADQTPMLIDWRAPAAASFYQATAAAPAGVTRRRHLATRGRTVTDLDDELLDAEALDADELTTVTGDGALMRALTARRTGTMRDIAATLQAEQDDVVRAGLDGVLVVQGGPGTGKTAVALHRAAYLLYTHRQRISRSGVLLVGPSTVFLRYIERVLPSLGETGVVLATPGQLYPGVTATVDEPDLVAALKGDLRMAAVLRTGVRDRQRLLPGPVPLSLDGDRITLRPAVVEQARGRARQTGRPHNEARVTFVRHLLDDLTTQLARARRTEPDADTRAELQAELRDSVDVRREINLCWMPLSVTGFVRRLLGSRLRLESAARGVLTAAEVELLLDSSGAGQAGSAGQAGGDGWSAADVPLLDEADELIGADVTAEAERTRARAQAATERQEALEYARGVLQMSGQSAEILTADALLTADTLADRFAASGPMLSVAERAGDDRTWAFGHVVVDEAQEVSPMLWRLLARRVPSRSMTVVGDLAQTGSAAGATSWAEVLDPVARGRWQLRELTVNYRTPAVIMEPATAMLTASGIGVRASQAVREGAWPPVSVQVSAGTGRRKALAEAAVRAVEADERELAGGRFAVLVPRADVEPIADAVRAGLGSGLAERVSVLTVTATKGLEFDAVVVADPAAMLRESPRGASDLYVALTRPTQRLTVLHHGDLPPGLDEIEAADQRGAD